MTATWAPWHPAAARAAGWSGTGACTQVGVPVPVPGLPATYQTAGLLCLPTGTPPPPLQVLVPGTTNDASYWEFPGHDLNLAVNHEEFFAVLSGWTSAQAR